VNTAFNFINAWPYNMVDNTDNLSGTSENDDRWDLAGNPGDFRGVGTTQLPCYGVTGSTFAKSGVCTTVASVAAMPLECTQASAALPVNLAVSGANSTGLAALQSFGCYMNNGSAIVPPAQGTYGNISRNEFFARGFRQWDLSVTKNWKIKERVSAQFRVEAFNVLNSTNFAAPGNVAGTNTNPSNPAAFGKSAATPDVSNGAPVFGTGGPRRIQLGAKFIF
jgi:hypothetical protein